jgi:hypothetical protein
MAPPDPQPELEEVVVSATRLGPPEKPKKSFLCRESAEQSDLSTLANNLDDAGDLADFTHPVVETGAIAAGAARPYSAAGTAFLGKELSKGLKNAARAGNGASMLAITIDLANKNYQQATFNAIDYGVDYSIARLSAIGAPETLGFSLAVGATTWGLYHVQGGSRGIIQEAFCKN